MDILIKLLYIFLFFFLGFISRKFGCLTKESAGNFLKLVHYITLPALVFITVITTKLEINLLMVPLIAFSTFLITLIISKRVVKKESVAPITKKTFILGSIIMNTGFVFPFIAAVLEKEGVFAAIVFDLTNTFLIFSLAYYIAASGSKKTEKSKYAFFRKVTSVPSLWAFLTGAVFRLTNISLPVSMKEFLELIAQPTIFLILISLGIYLHINSKKYILLIKVISIRMLIGFLAGLTLCLTFKLQGDVFLAVIISCAAPVGYNTLIFSKIERLDVDFAAELVSFSMLIGFITTPLLLFIFK